MKKKNTKNTNKRARKIFAKGKSKNVAKPAVNDEVKAKKQKQREAKRARLAAKRERAKAKRVRELERAKKLRAREKAKKQKQRDQAKKLRLQAREKAKKARLSVKTRVDNIRARAKKALLKERERTAKERAKVKALAAKAKKMKTIIPANDTKKLSPKEAALAMKSALKTIADQLAALQADQRFEEIAALGKLGYEAAISDEGVLTVHFTEAKTKKLKIEKKPKPNDAELVEASDDAIPDELSDERINKLIDESTELFGDPETNDDPQEIPAGDLFGTDGEVIEPVDGVDEFGDDVEDDDDSDDDKDEDEDDEDDDSITDTRDDDDQDRIDFRREWNNEFDDDGERVEY